MACFSRMTFFLSIFSNFLDNIQLYSSPLSTSNGTVQRPVPPPPPSRDGTLSRFSPFWCSPFSQNCLRGCPSYLHHDQPTSPGWRRLLPEGNVLGLLQMEDEEEVVLNIINIKFIIIIIIFILVMEDEEEVACTDVTSIVMIIYNNNNILIILKQTHHHNTCHNLE